MINKHAGIVRLMARLAGAAMLCAALFGTPSAPLTAVSQWHVNSAGVDDAGCGSSGDPCRTISYLLPNVTSGDEIYVTGELTDSFTLDKNVAIVGSAGAILNGNGARVMTVNAGVSATISNLTLRNGGGTQDGGLVHNAGTLAINNAILTQGNVTGANGGAIFNSGTLTLTGSTISNSAAQQGGGIENTGVLFISTSTVANNQSIYGGGIDNVSGGTVHLNRAVVINNSASSGGGIYNDASVSARMWLTDTAVVSNTAQNDAGGIFNGGQLSLVNVTVSNNRLSGGPGVAIYHQFGSLTMQHVTLAGNTVANRIDASAIKLDGASTIKNTVFANSSVDNCSGNATSNGYNLSSDASCSFLSQPTDSTSVDALLGELQPSALAYATFTHSPLQGSLLVNRIPAGACTIASDQRGTSRPQDGACDIGALEAIPVDLSLAAQSQPASLPAGTSLNVQLTVGNAGPSAATGVVITSDVPAGTTLSSCASNAGCVLAGTRLTMTLGTLNAGANMVTSVQLVPQKGGNLAFSFNAGSLGWDRQNNNNTASVTAQVLESADIGITLSGPPSVLAGAPFTLSVQVENRSEFAASALAFTLTLPAQVTYKGSFGGNWSCSPNADTLQCIFASPLQPKSQSPVDILLSSGSAPAELKFMGSATSSTFDPNPSNNTDSRLLKIESQLKAFIPVVVR